AMDMDSDAILVSQVRRIDRQIAAAYPRTCLEAGDVLLGIVRTAKVAVVPPALAGGNIVRGIARLAPIPGLSQSISRHGLPAPRHRAGCSQSTAESTCR